MRFRGESRTAGLTIAAQSVASLTNFVAVALAQSVSSLEGFGRAFIVFQLTQVLVAVAVGSVGSAILTHTSGDPESDRVKDLRAGGALVSVGAGLAASAAFALAAAFTSSDLRLPLLLAALGAPGLMAQYVLRSMYFGRRNPAAVLVMDTVWLVIVVGAVPLAAVTGTTTSANYYLSAWLVGAAVSGAPLLLTAARAKGSQVRTFLVVTGRQAFLTGVDGLLARTVVVGLLFSTRAFEGEAAVGAVGAAMLPFTPMAVVHTSAFAIAVPAMLRRGGIRKIGPRVPALVSAIVVVITFAWMAGIFALNALPISVGPFDVTRDGITTSLLLATFARYVALGARNGPAIGLRAADAAQEQLVSRVIGTAMQWVLPVFGLMLGGVAGGAWGLAIGTFIGVFETWRRFARLPAVAGSGDQR